MLDLGKIQDDIYDHLLSFHVPEAHAFALSGLILAEVIQPLLTRECAAAEAAALERAALAADAQYKNAVDATQGYGEWARCATAIAAAIRALT